MAKVVQPKSDFSYDQHTNTLTYFAKVKSRARMVLVMILLIPMAFIIVGGFAFGFLGWGQGGGYVILVAAITSVLAWFLIKWAEKPRETPVVFDSRAITVKGKSYLLDHISQVGWSRGGGWYASGPGIQGAAMIGAAQIRDATSGQIFIIYGADQIPIITGIDPSQVEFTHQNVIRFLQHVGHDFSDQQA